MDLVVTAWQFIGQLDDQLGQLLQNYGAWTYLILFLIIFAVAYFAGRRGFCHVLCPVAGLMVLGRKIRNRAGWPALQLRADATLCTDCKRCSRGCPMGLDVNGMVRKGEMENPDCIMCASCADTCPQGAITYGVKGR